jgi:hypothetical protein
MRLICGNLASFRLVVLVWASLWMLMVPFFHVHPEADHHHGDASHVHGGTIHTVFSPDLECEYQDVVHDSTCPEAAHQHLQARAHAGHALNHPEIEFSLLTAPIDRSLPKAGMVLSGLPLVEHTATQRAVAVVLLQPGPAHTILFLSSALPLRAPPSQSV